MIAPTERPADIYSGTVWRGDLEMKIPRTISLTVFTLATFVFSSATMADHSWGRYEWKPASALLNLELGHNVDSNWDGYLTDARTDWNVSQVIDATIKTGSTSGAVCDVASGNVQVCNADYGNTGWLGIAQIQVSKGSTIVAGRAKLNDYYFDQSFYNTPEWRRMVMCQEIAHTFGLDHQDESFSNANLGTCMDYTSDPTKGGIVNDHPNLHDYEQLEAMYGDGGGGDSVDSGDGGCNPRSPKCNPATSAGGHAEFGQLVSGHGGIEVFERDLGNGRKLITQVTWTLEYASSHKH